MKARERTMQRQRNTRKKKSTSSQTKTFDTRKYQDIVVRFNERMIGKEFLILIVCVGICTSPVLRWRSAYSEANTCDRRTRLIP